MVSCRIVTFKLLGCNAWQNPNHWRNANWATPECGADRASIVSANCKAEENGMRSAEAWNWKGLTPYADNEAYTSWKIPTDDITIKRLNVRK